MQYGVFLNKTTKYKKELNTCVYIYIYIWIETEYIYIYVQVVNVDTLLL